jgi:tight adherence protein C
MQNAATPTIMGIDVMIIATLLSSVATLAVLVAIYMATTVRNPMAKRIKSLNERRDELRAGLNKVGSDRRAKLIQKNVHTDRIRSILDKFKMLQDEQLEAAQLKLMQAGIRSKDLAVAVIFGRLVMPILLGGGAALAVYVLDWYPDWSPFKKFLFVAAGLIGGYKAPDLFVQNKITKRTSGIRKGLPDALDLLVICAEAGLTVDAAFGRVAKELGKAYPELGDEFALTSIELGFLTERRQAFENLSHRVNLDAMRGVVTTMIQTEKYGTPLASALRVLSGEFRNERMMRAEEKAARLPAIMTVPLILFILPTLFVVILGPAACSIADAFAGS